MMGILAYILRHGTTSISPKSEGWLQVPLDDLGRAQAADAGEFLKKQKVRPDFAVSSDLARAVQTCEIASKILGIKVIRPMADLRAFGDDKESQKDFEEKNERAFTEILSASKAKKRIPLITCHRSNTAWLAKKFGGVHQHIDYRQASLIWEGGVLALDENGVQPLYKSLTENPNENLVPKDGTFVSGFVTVRDNRPPRECGNCRWMDVDHCDNPIVTADDELGIIYGLARNSKGKWGVPANACCDSFQNKIDPKEAVSSNASVVTGGMVGGGKK